ncbi:MAG TPA: phytanoyl-CoA dioxygenase family protein [Terracidiphilus sp.]|jgi:ectoine hydroxylase-related dioxygenase (phytanoyl-CoA dioxygenase family)|nr:phytanoyl-CoA dioxygenase family protein [Terracidiphilus sp.]
MKPFSEVPADHLTSDLLHREIGSKGYVLVRNVLPRPDISKVLSEVAEVLSRAGWLNPAHDPADRIANAAAACGDPDPAFKTTYREVFNLESFHALPHHPQLKAVMKMIVGERVLIHPKPIGRLIFPNSERLRVHAHQDYRFMNGDPECYTVWIPLHDCPTEVGPLQILEGSHHFGFQTHIDENLHVPEIPAGAEMGDEWAGGDINAGDVLIFHSLTVHAAAPNLSDRMRISLDCRFQDYARAINPANLAFAGDSGKSWDEIYQSWRSRNLQYYWKSLPLNFQPSRAEIEHLSHMAASPSMRARYGRILAQIA